MYRHTRFKDREAGSVTAGLFVCNSASDCASAAAALRKRHASTNDIDAVVERILEMVRTEGDRALLQLTEELDCVRLETLMIDGDEMKALSSDVDGEILDAMRIAASNIERFHSRGLPAGHVLEFDGSRVEREYVPLRRVGIYVPGGNFAYPSTVLMAAIPARIAGVGETVLFTPPDRSGRRLRYVAAACQLSGIENIYTVGGAQAVAAMAFGTESIRKVDKIVGPGNSYVARAKAIVASLGLTGIDSIAGPTEILVLADRTAIVDEEIVASELIAQMEHGSGACGVLCSDSEELIAAVTERMNARLASAGVAASSAMEHYSTVLAASPESMEQFAEEYAPEHLFAVGEVAEKIGNRVRNAGSVFIGRYSSVAFGDYITGTNHILPTMGTARFSSPLQVTDFMKVVERQRISSTTAEKLSAYGSTLAKSEGLSAHAAAMELRDRSSGVTGKDEQ